MRLMQFGPSSLLCFQHSRLCMFLFMDQISFNIDWTLKWNYCLSDISGWMTNNKLRLNVNKTDFVILGTSRQRSKLTNFFLTNILSHSITPSDTVRNFGVTFDSDFNFRKHVSLTLSLLFLSYSWLSPYSALYFSFSSQNHCYSTHY